jgi:hypothetical protein
VFVTYINESNWHKDRTASRKVIDGQHAPGPMPGMQDCLLQRGVDENMDSFLNSQAVGHTLAGNPHKHMLVFVGGLEPRQGC